jgi:Cys-rich four helix bundle protein (predicted Tat secretion target)
MNEGGLMNRRELLLTMSTLAAGTLGTGLAFADSKSKKAAAADGANPNAKLIDTAEACIKAGDMCIQHCQTMLSTGDTSLSNCLRTSLEMVEICRTLTKFAAFQSKNLKKVAAACAEVCRDCEKSCREHEAHHKICKDCAECCAACAKECDKVAA